MKDPFSGTTNILIGSLMTTGGKLKIVSEGYRIT
jgi:hypothetical protein